MHVLPEVSYPIELKRRGVFTVKVGAVIIALGIVIFLFIVTELVFRTLKLVGC